MYYGKEPLMSNYEIRANARMHLKGNWVHAILAYLIFAIITSLPSTIPEVGWIISILIAGPMYLGIVKFSINLRRHNNTDIEVIFDGFKNFTTAMILQILITLFVVLWSLLLIVPGIIASLNYSLAFYILNDNPELTAMEALSQSKAMMYGYRWKLFCLYLSFIGWAILCVLTFGIGSLWLNPYIGLSVANFYDNLKNSDGTIY
ncbi:DUF975 family protein [Clostridium ganghwense]|uniref:DUF975 family protein n=1 Tax=Clostridium ganghwense TaxID=312089 RepID=A0ABT4CSQ4_9CLOT|nr:DUF975 family protein [Clostridium ganghwense]MCY6372092.1 DUF975 family protein [Clostridium ganghwense]